MEKISSYYKERVPKLKAVFEPYLKYIEGPGDITHTNWASAEEGYFAFQVNDPNIRNDEEVHFYCYETYVKVVDVSNGEWHRMTHENCLAYLEQIPRSWYNFVTREET
tara:strand:+ start:1161 stop:1484 length:324 start_codon:yes stop_codon:yes gene_type:complete